jgi:hypothetical protein
MINELIAGVQKKIPFINALAAKSKANDVPLILKKY